MATWPRMVRLRTGSSGSGLSTLGDDVERDVGHRQHPAAARRAGRPATSSAATGSPPSSLDQAGEQQVADGVPGQRRRCRRTGAAAASATCWVRSSSPASAASAIRRSPGGRTRQLAAQPAAGAAVVGDRHDGGQLGGDLAQRAPAPPRARGRRRGRPPGAAAAAGRGHSRPRSRWRRPRRRRPRRPAAGRAPRPSRRCGACRRCSRPRGSGSACPRGGSRGDQHAQHLAVAVEELRRRPPGRARSRGPAVLARCAGAARGPSAGWAGSGSRRPGRRPPGGRTCSRSDAPSRAAAGCPRRGERVLASWPAARAR